MRLRFGRYIVKDDVKDELGRGAFGKVYRAFDPNVHRDVAVKILFSQSDPDMVSRFRDESKTAGNLEHENIVKIFDHDLQDGVPFLVMELLEGETLETVIQQGLLFGKPVEILDKVEIMFQVAKGLAYAHSKNVIHRDIKPSNIMVRPDGTAKVMDFGIARVTDPDGSRSSQPGEIAGTILYMAPEQFKDRSADQRSDIFSYGDVYYELLTGEQPFYAKDPAAVLYRVTTYDPPPLREKVPNCPEALEILVQRLMAKDRELRPDRFEEVKIDTEPILQQLRQSRAATILTRIPVLMDAGDEEQADWAVREVLRLDPLNSEARRWRLQLQRFSYQRSLRKRATTLLNQGQELIASRQFGEAMEYLEKAQKLDREHPGLAAALDEARFWFEAAKRASHHVNEALAALERDDLSTAAINVKRAVELDHGNAEALALLDEVNKRIQSQREATTGSEVEQFREAEEYQESLTVLQELGSEQPAFAELKERVEQERSAKDKRNWNTCFQIKLAKARDSLFAQHLKDALQAAEALCVEYPDQPAAADFRLEVREYLAAQKRVDAVGSVIQEAHALIRAKRHADARERLEGGLRSYPGDRNMRALLDSVAQFANTQVRERKIDEALQRCHSLQESEQLDAALARIEAVIAELGQESRLLDCQRQLLFDRQQRQRGADLDKELENARKMLQDDKPLAALAILEECAFLYPGEAEVAQLLSSTRTALAASNEKEFVNHSLARISNLESRGHLATALETTQAALIRYPENEELQSTALRLQPMLEQRRREAALGRYTRRIEEALQTEEWQQAAEWHQRAQQAFPSEQGLVDLAARMETARRKAELDLLSERVAASLGSVGLKRAEGLLVESRAAFGEEPAWQALWAEFERRRAYDNQLVAADEARARGDFDAATDVLQAIANGAPDDRAARALKAVSEERARADERARREAEEQARREAEEEARLQREEAIRNGRRDAAELVEQQNFKSAIEVLAGLNRQFPGNVDVQREWQAAILLDQDHREEEIKREAEEKARQEREVAVASARKEAADLVEQGDFRGAVAVLSRIDRKYPNDPDVQTERQTALELDRQREEQLNREAKERARQERDAAIASGRREAAALVEKGDFHNARELLDFLNRRFPGSLELQQDRESAIQLERQNEERLKREAAQQSTRQRDLAIRNSRREASELIQEGYFAAAITLLSRLAQQYPDDVEVRKDWESAVQRERQWREEQKRREAEEAARRQRERLISLGRTQAAELAQAGDFQEAIAVLDRLSEQFPDVAEIRQDRDDVSRLERQRHLAEQRAKEALARFSARQRVDRPTSPGGDMSPLNESETKNLSLAAEQRAKQALTSYSESRREVSPDRWSVTPEVLSFESHAGQFPSAPQRIVVNGASFYRLETNATWLRAQAKEGSVEVCVEPSGMKAGQYSATLTVFNRSGSQRHVTVWLLLG